jgi:hypothetical protein
MADIEDLSASASDISAVEKPIKRRNYTKNFEHKRLELL